VVTREHVPIRAGGRECGPRPGDVHRRPRRSV